MSGLSPVINENFIKEIVTCDHEGCNAKTLSVFQAALQPTLFKQGLRAQGWWTVDILSSKFPGPKQLCPEHKGKALGAM